MSPGPATLKSYRLLLSRLLLLPVLALSLLALALAYALQKVEHSAALVDHSDEVLTHFNHLVKLIVDQETGVRGYLLTSDPLFLEPYLSATQPIGSEFSTLSALVSDGQGQGARLRRLRSSYGEWQAEAQREIRAKASVQDLERDMLERKQSMDAIRTQADEFNAQEEHIRAGRSVAAHRVGRRAVAGMVALFIVAALLVVWETWRIFHELTSAFQDQLLEVNRQREEAFRREQWLNTTIRSIGDGVIACNPEGRVVFMNAVSETLTGWREDEARGLPLSTVFEIVNEETRATVENPVDKVLRLGTIVGLANHTVLIRKDRSEISIDDSAAPIRDSSSRLSGIVLVFRDVSDRRVSEQALMRAEKLASVGRMASSMAHEINNPLEAVINLVYLARREDQIERIRPLLDHAETELNRITQVTRQTLAFYQEHATHTRFKPADVVKRLAEFYGTLAARKGIQLIVDTPGEGEILGSPGELRQALANVLLNSLEACQSGGIIRVNVRLAADAVDSMKPGIRVTIADSGCGIPSVDRERLFEPFFTTKKDTGIGLGLWVSKQLIEKHGGRIGLRSRSRGTTTGTVVSIFVPQTPAPTSAQTANL